MGKLIVAALAAWSLALLAGAARADSGWIFTSSLVPCVSEVGGCPDFPEFADAQNASAIPKGGYVPGGLEVFNPIQLINYSYQAVTDGGVDTYTYATYTATSDRVVDFNFEYFWGDVTTNIADPAGIVTSGGYALDFRSGTPTNCQYPNPCRTLTGSGSFEIHAGETVTVYAGVVGSGYIYGSSSASVFGNLFSATPLPEPTSWALALIGLGGMGSALRIRRIQRRIGT